MHGPSILCASMTANLRKDRYGNRWQYLSRGDHHSKVACWGTLFDLMLACPLLRTNIQGGQVGFGINHSMRDFKQDRKKDLDLVLCTPGAGLAGKTASFVSLIDHYGVVLDSKQQEQLDGLPGLDKMPVGSVLLALEAKACMTAHQRALPRLYDELNSSHLTIHGSSDDAIAAGFLMVNAAERYLSPDLNKRNRSADPEWSLHQQPRDAVLAVDKLRQLPRRTRPGEEGYDALAVVVVDCKNDGSSVELVEGAPAPQAGDNYHYASMINRLAATYSARFSRLG